jgi:adenylate cyclase
MTQNDATQTQVVDNPGSSEIVRQIKKKVSDATQLIRSQADLLRQRGVNISPSVQESLKALKGNVDTLEVALSRASGELRSLRALAQTTALINSGQSTDEVLNQVMDTVINLTKAERGYIVLKNQVTGELEFKAARGTDLEEVRSDGSSDRVISRSIVNKVADTGVPILTDNASQDSVFSNNLSIVSKQLRSILAVPLKLREQVIGVVYADNRFQTALFKPSDLEMLNNFASQASVALENARLFDEARRKVNEVSAIRDRMDNIFTSIDSGIITLNEDELVIVCNIAAEKILANDEIIGKNLRDVLPQMTMSFYATMEEVMKTGDTRGLEITTIFKDKPCQWYFNISPLRDDTHSIIGLALVLDDLTEQRQRESQLAEVQRYLPAGLVKNARDLDTGAQEREISAIFCDVRGFTSFSEGRQPQDLMKVINQYLALASDAINLVEGVVDKYMGDAVTGLFNTQLNPQDNHAERAVQAAWQLRTDLLAQHEIMPEEQRLFYGVGIHTGSAVMGIVGSKTRKEFSALGEAADIAKYLQEQAGKGEVIISEATYQLVSHRYECEPLTELVRPKEEYKDIKCYRVVKPKKGLSSSFVDDELLSLLNDLKKDE